MEPYGDRLTAAIYRGSAGPARPGAAGQREASDRILFRTKKKLKGFQAIKFFSVKN
jgi:hypothetical protein